MKKVLRFLGVEGRITIPLSIRFSLGLETGDIISFAQDGGKIILQKEKLCNDCRNNEESNIIQFIDALTKNEQHSLLVALTLKLAERNEKL